MLWMRRLYKYLMACCMCMQVPDVGIETTRIHRLDLNSIFYIANSRCPVICLRGVLSARASAVPPHSIYYACRVPCARPPRRQRAAGRSRAPTQVIWSVSLGLAMGGTWTMIVLMIVPA
jgi:hypothetical protein